MIIPDLTEVDTLKVKARIFLDLCLANYRSKVRIGSRRAIEA